LFAVIGRGRHGKHALSVRRIMSAFKHIQMFFATAGVAIALSSLARADTSIATRWKPLGEAQDDCLAHAQMAIWRAGFDKSEPGSQSMSGKRGEYTASIRCLADQRMVFFVIAGPSAAVTASYLDALFGHF
jgi:hypothetical protein